MAGWSREKRERVEAAFYSFLGRCYVNSKDLGRICLGEHVYEGQRRAITQIFDALEEDIHDIYILKSRQLGISTIIRALIAFLAGVFKGVKGAIVFDTDNNKIEARAEIKLMIDDLPSNLKFPEIKEDNRQGLALANDSKLLFMSAGVRKTRGSGTLGRSVGLSLAHLSELCSYDNDEGLESFKQSLSDMNPDRLYIYESTARGYNSWHTMWHAARADPSHCKCIFLGWWSKDSQKIERDHRDFKLYGEFPPNEKERQQIRQVKELYGHDITPEQLAWVRRKYDPTARQEGDAIPTFEADSTRVQEQPWTEDEAFQQTGTIFFEAKNLKDQTDKHVSRKFTTYMFLAGQEFCDMRIIRAPTVRAVELKVWEEPSPNATYVVGVDPAFGENPDNDRSAIQVMRCYADGLDQVAEYAWPMHTARQTAWVAAALMGWYGQHPSTSVRYILEMNGPGTAVFNELRSLKHQVTAGYPALGEDAVGLRNFFRNVQAFIGTRPDALGPSSNWHIKTTTRTKVQYMERLRDFVSAGLIYLRSFDTLEEMKAITREGDTIKAAGTKKDDRVLALAFAVHCWEEKVRRLLITQKRTRQAEASRGLDVRDVMTMFNTNMLDSYWKDKRVARVREQQKFRVPVRWGERRFR